MGGEGERSIAVVKHKHRELHTQSPEDDRSPGCVGEGEAPVLGGVSSEVGERSLLPGEGMPASPPIPADEI